MQTPERAEQLFKLWTAEKEESLARYPLWTERGGSNNANIKRLQAINDKWHKILRKEMYGDGDRKARIVGGINQTVYGLDGVVVTKGITAERARIAKAKVDAAKKARDEELRQRAAMTPLQRMRHDLEMSGYSGWQVDRQLMLQGIDPKTGARLPGDSRDWRDTVSDMETKAFFGAIGGSSSGVTVMEPGEFGSWVRKKAKGAKARSGRTRRESTDGSPTTKTLKEFYMDADDWTD